MADWQIEQVGFGILGIFVLAIFLFLSAWLRLCDRVTKLEAFVKLLEREIKAIHDKED